MSKKYTYVYVGVETYEKLKELASKLKMPRICDVITYLLERPNVERKIDEILWEIRYIRKRLEGPLLTKQPEHAIKAYLSVLHRSQFAIRVWRGKPDAKRLRANMRYWVKKYYGHTWFSIVVAKGYDKVALSVAQIENKYIVFDVLAIVLPYPPDFERVKELVKVAFDYVIYMCNRNRCVGVEVDPELPIDLKVFGLNTTQTSQS